MIVHDEKMKDLDASYRAEGWGKITDAALRIRPSDVESQARDVARFVHGYIADLFGTIDEYRALPCDSLRKRMFAARDRLRENGTACAADDRGARLFNCCADNAPPDWSQYNRLEIGGCRAGDDETIGGIGAGAAEFFTIYGRFKAPDGTCEAITDVEDPRALLAVAAELALISGLPIIVAPTLGDA